MVKKLGILGFGLCVGFVGGVVAAKYGKHCLPDETNNDGNDSDEEFEEEFVELTESEEDVNETENASNEEAAPETESE